MQLFVNRTKKSICFFLVTKIMKRSKGDALELQKTN